MTARKAEVPITDLIKVWCERCCIRIAPNEEQTVARGKTCCLAWVQWGGRSLLRRYFGLREIRVVANGCETNPVQPENVPSRTSNGYNRIEKHSNCKESCRPGYFPARTACATKLGVASDLKWQANLRVLEVTEIKTVPYVPLSHPFVERLIGDNGENTWTRRSSGQRPIWRRSYSSSNITIMHIERTPG